MPEEKNTKVSEYVSEKIGDEYKAWGEGDIVFITAPTGSGKSYFTLHIFLKWIVERKYRMLYLVNRRILQKQLEEELHEEVEDEIYQEQGMLVNSLQNYVTISTYQSIERGLKGKKQLETIRFLQGFNCVVYDECHYFYSDSNFNTSTELSYLTLRKEFNKKLQIYISATPDKIRSSIEEYVVQVKKEIMGSMPPELLFKSNRIKEYSVKNSYDYIELSIFENVEDLIGVIRRNVNVEREKWLIFVDSIDLGKELRNKLLSEAGGESDSGEDEYKISEKDVIFLDAHYGKEEDTRESVEEIAKEKISSKKVVISTAVMDNGVSFHDLGLRNIVILADTKEMFLQMLGRKRKDGYNVKLYICKQNIKHFDRRQRHIEKVLECYGRYGNELSYINEPHINKNIEGEVLKKRYVEVMYENNQINYWCCLVNQQGILDELLTNYISSRYIGEFCYSVNGLLIPNMFSIGRYRDMKIFYKDIIKRLESDEYAFIRQQATWLGISEEKLESVILYSQKSDYEKNREILEQEIEKILDKPMKLDEIAKWKRSIKDVLIYFIKRDEKFKESDISGITGPDRSLSKKMFERCVKQARLSYKMEVTSANNKKGTETSYMILR